MMSDVVGALKGARQPGAAGSNSHNTTGQEAAGHVRSQSVLNYILYIVFTLIYMFQFSCGQIPLDLIFQRYLPQHILLCLKMSFLL